MSSRPLSAPISELLPEPVAPITAIKAFCLPNGFVRFDELVEAAIGIEKEMIKLRYPYFNTYLHKFLDADEISRDEGRLAALVLVVCRCCRRVCPDKSKPS